jgi:hypothetical protein
MKASVELRLNGFRRHLWSTRGSCSDTSHLHSQNSVLSRQRNCISIININSSNNNDDYCFASPILVVVYCNYSIFYRPSRAVAGGGCKCGLAFVAVRLGNDATANCIGGRRISWWSRSRAVWYLRQQ